MAKDQATSLPAIDEDDDGYTLKQIVAFTIVAVIILAALLWLWLFLGDIPRAVAMNTSTEGLEDAARIGDSWGMANSFFTCLALAGAICAIILQWRELTLQRRELRLTRTVFKDELDAQRESKEALKQQVEMSFYTAYLSALGSLRTAFESDARTLKGVGIISGSLISERRMTWTISAVLDYIGKQGKSFLPDLEPPAGSRQWITEELFKCLVGLDDAIATLAILPGDAAAAAAHEAMKVASFQISGIAIAPDADLTPRELREMQSFQQSMEKAAGDNQGRPAGELEATLELVKELLRRHMLLVT